VRRGSPERRFVPGPGQSCALAYLLDARALATRDAALLAEVR
jgi:hypothetical protein